MNSSDVMKRYLESVAPKYGLFMSGGKCLYLFGNQYCEAYCTRLILKSESTELDVKYRENLFIIVHGELCEVYINGKRILRLNELIVSYEILQKGQNKLYLYGIITGGREFPPNALQFTDKRIMELLLKLLDRRKEARACDNKGVQELTELISMNEVKSRSELYLSADVIEHMS